MLNRIFKLRFTTYNGLEGWLNISIVITPLPDGKIQSRICKLHPVQLSNGQTLSVEDFLNRFDVPTRKAIGESWIQAAQDYVQEHINEFKINPQLN